MELAHFIYWPNKLYSVILVVRCKSVNLHTSRRFLTVSKLSLECCAIFIFAILQSKNIFGRIFIVELVSELQFTTWSRKTEGIISELFFPFYLRSTCFIFVIYSILHLILLYPLVLLYSQRLTTLYVIQTSDSKLLSPHKSYSI